MHVGKSLSILLTFVISLLKRQQKESRFFRLEYEGDEINQRQECIMQTLSSRTQVHARHRRNIDLSHYFHSTIVIAIVFL